MNIAVSCCVPSIIDEKRQEWEVGTFTHGRGYERTQWSDSLHAYSLGSVCQPLSMCGERCNVLTHFSVCTADISLSYADSNYLRTANPPEGGRRREGEVEEWGRQWSSDTGETVMLRSMEGSENERWGEGEGAEMRARQWVNIFLMSAVTWCGGGERKALNGDRCIKYGLPIFPVHSISLPFYFTFYIKTKDGTWGI